MHPHTHAQKRTPMCLVCVCVVVVLVVWSAEEVGQWQTTISYIYTFMFDIIVVK